MNTWIPLWLLRDMISTLEHQLTLLAKKDDTILETTEIMIQEDYETPRGIVDVSIRAYSKDKKDYAYAKRKVTKKLIREACYTPPLVDPKTSEQMMQEIMGKLEVDVDSWSNEKDGEI